MATVTKPIILDETGQAMVTALQTIASHSAGLVGQGVPSGGTTGQILAKKSNTDYDTEWVAKDSGIFWVTYNVTTYSQIKAADVSGKLPVIRMNVVSSNSYTTSEFYLTRLTDSSAVFVADNPTSYGIRTMVVICDSSDVWSMDYSAYDSEYVAYNSATTYSAGTVGKKLSDLDSAIPSAYTSNPAALGTASAGSSTYFSRGDHVHPLPSAGDVGAIAAPANPSSGQFLVYNGSAWVAQTVPSANGVSF